MPKSFIETIEALVISTMFVEFMSRKTYNSKTRNLNSFKNDLFQSPRNVLEAK